MSDLFVQKSDYALGLSEHRIIVKNGNREIVREISIHLVENILVFGTGPTLYPTLTRVGNG